MEYQIAIPSYRRAETLRDKTLGWLHRSNVDLNRVKVFVADGDEQCEYQEVLQRSGIPPVELVVGEVGHLNIRNFIQRYYDPGTKVVSIDDDLRDIYQKVDDKTVEPVPDVDGFFRQAFEMADAAGIRLWGVYPVPNPYFMKHQITTKLCYVPGGLFGLTMTRDPETFNTIENKADFERSILYYLADGAVMRFDHICMGTTGYKGAGGMQVARTPQIIRECAENLARRFPELATLNLTKKSGMPEVRLRDRRKR